MAVIAHCSHSSNSSISQQHPPSFFPYGRFVDYAAAPAQPLLGKFLAQDRVIDIDGFGMGPKPLAHVDPFKLLITDRVNHLLRRLPSGVAGSSGTAMVMCCNMGGERFSNAYSSAHNFYGQAQGMPPGVEVTDVATMLPNMLSGYPAQIFLTSRVSIKHWLAPRVCSGKPCWHPGNGSRRA